MPPSGKNDMSDASWKDLSQIVRPNRYDARKTQARPEHIVEEELKTPIVAPEPEDDDVSPSPAKTS